MYTVESLLMTSKRKLTQFKGLSDVKVEKMQDAASKVSTKLQFHSGREIAQRREQEIVKITTGCKELDRILGGGLETGVRGGGP